MSQRWDNIVQAIRRLPGVGPKMAERLALYFLRSDQTDHILTAIKDAKDNLKNCQLCGVYTDVPVCARCSDYKRDSHFLCVVEEISDLMALEKSGAYHGHYHLLGGVLAPLDGIGPNDLRINALLDRLKKSGSLVEEVILATNPTVEGEATATYLSHIIKPLGPRVTRLATGLPSGSSLEYADDLTVTRAFEGRLTIA